LAGGENPEELVQPYPDSADNSAQCIYDYYDSEGETAPQFVAGHFIPIDERINNSHKASTFTTDVSGVVNSSIYTASVNELIDVSETLNKDLIKAVIRKPINIQDGVTTFMISGSGAVDKFVYSASTGQFDLFNLDGGII